MPFVHALCQHEPMDAPTVEIRLLGRFSARRQQEEVSPATFGGRLVRRLVRVLVSRRGHYVSRDVLAEALWPGRMPADPDTNLRVLVNRARRALGDGSLIQTGPGGYSFTHDERCWVDAEAFMAEVAAGHQHLADGEAGAALRRFVSALENWGGEPLPEDDYDDWAQGYRHGLTRAHLQALEEGATAALAVRDPNQAVDLAERAVAREPLRESASLLLARAFAASGDAVAALRSLEALRRRLGEEVGLEPSPEVAELEKEILGVKPAKLFAPRIMSAPAHPVFEGLPFVGRDEELQLIGAAIAEPAPGVVLVSGTSGVGKSRLLAEAALASGVPVLAARAFLPERDEPWALARSMLQEALSLDVDAAHVLPGRVAEALADILPEIAELRPVGRDVGDPESRRALALEGAARLMAATTTTGALLVVDDLQWADATSLAVLSSIARRLKGTGLAFAFRPEEITKDAPAETFLRDLRGFDRRLTTITLTSWSAAHIAEIVADARLAGAIAEETDRTPLAVNEVMRTLVARGAVQRDAWGRWEARAEHVEELARQTARNGQRQAIQDRAARRPANQREILAMLALVGREVPARVLATARQSDQQRVLNDLDVLARAGLVRLGEAGWATAHDIIREAVAESLEREERGRIHQLLAQALDDEGGDPAELAQHLAGAGDRTSAAAAFAEAAKRRLEEFAGDEACHLCDAGLGLEPGPALRVKLLEVRGEARALRGDNFGARDDLRAAIAGLVPGPERSRTLARIAILISGAADLAETCHLTEMALTEAGTDPAARAEALAVAAIIDTHISESDRAKARAVESLALFERLGDTRGVAAALDGQALQLFFDGHFPEAVELYQRVARLYRDSGQLLKVGSVKALRGFALVFMDRADEGLAELDEALDLERTLGQSEGEAMCMIIRSEALTALGRRQEARETAEAALNRSRQLRNREWISSSLRSLAACHVAEDDHEVAATLLREAIEIVEDMPWPAGVLRSRLASSLVALGNLAGAEEEAARALRVAGGFVGLEARLVLAEISLRRGQADAEVRALDALAAAEAGGYRRSPTRERLERFLPAATPSEGGPPRVRRERKTFMFTDIVRSTNLVDALGDQAWDQLLRWHDHTLRAAFGAHGGQEVNRIGDGFFVAFDHSQVAVSCAVAIQETLERQRAEHGFAPQVRIGIHEAEATRVNHDYQGRGVHEAARIGAQADAGEIVVSAATAAHLDGVPCSAPRSVLLKGLSKPMEVVAIDWR